MIGQLKSNQPSPPSMGLLKQPCKTCGCKWGYVDYYHEPGQQANIAIVKCGCCDREQN